MAENDLLRSENSKLKEQIEEINRQWTEIALTKAWNSRIGRLIRGLVDRGLADRECAKSAIILPTPFWYKNENTELSL